MLVVWAHNRSGLYSDDEAEVGHVDEHYALEPVMSSIPSAVVPSREAVRHDRASLDGRAGPSHPT